MPYSGPNSALCVSYYKGTLLSILLTEFCTGDNITSEQANVPCRELSQEVLWRSLAALVGLHEGTTQAKHQWPWVLDDAFYFIACNFDFSLAYAAARVAWKHFNEHSVDSNIISIQRGQWWVKHDQGQLR